MELTAKAREASAYAAGAAQASWEALIKAADQAREAGHAWSVVQEAEASQGDLVAGQSEPPRLTDPVAIAEATVKSVLPGETRRRLRQQAETAASRARDAKEIAEFTGNMALQAAREWGEAERAWRGIRESLTPDIQLPDGARADNLIGIRANGSEFRVPDGITVAAFVESRGLPIDSCIAELNGVALTRSELATSKLKDGDRVEIVRAVAGGAAAPGTGRRASRREAISASRLYFICSATRRPEESARIARLAIAGGVSAVQVRDHDATDAKLFETAMALRSATAELGAVFIVNDRVDIALATGADGVHIGQDDLAPAVVRRLAGPELVIGLSTHSKEEIDNAQLEGVDYIGVGPVFETPTKEGRKGTGLDLIRYASLHSKIPFFAIGGLDLDRIPAVAEAGAKRIAVVRAIEGSDDPSEASASLLGAVAAGALTGT